MTGTVNLQKSTVTFSGVPDVPQTKLVVALFGGKLALESSNCTLPVGTLSGSFTGQNGAVVNGQRAGDRPGLPQAGRRSFGLRRPLSVSANGNPVLRFRLTKGSNAPGLKAFNVTLPNGLSFNARRTTPRAFGSWREGDAPRFEGAS